MKTALWISLVIIIALVAFYFYNKHKADSLASTKELEDAGYCPAQDGSSTSTGDSLFSVQNTGECRKPSATPLSKKQACIQRLPQTDSTGDQWWCIWNEYLGFCDCNKPTNRASKRFI